MLDLASSTLRSHQNPNDTVQRLVSRPIDSMRYQRNDARARDLFRLAGHVSTDRDLLTIQYHVYVHVDALRGHSSEQCLDCERLQEPF